MLSQIATPLSLPTSVVTHVTSYTSPSPDPHGTIEMLYNYCFLHPPAQSQSNN